MKFETINKIDIYNDLSWKDKIFLTFDIDWCSDEVLSYTLDILEKHNAKATFFVTHNTKILNRMIENENIELGIHPNFNFLLSGDFRYGKNINSVVEYYKRIIPNAVSVRSHCMTQNSNILDCFDQFGLSYDCNTFIPFLSGVVTMPYRHWTNNLIKVPYFWEDDIHCLYGHTWNYDIYLNNDCIKVFDFHPIHIFLNTECLSRYNNAKIYSDNYSKLSKHINNRENGAMDFLIDILKSQE